MKRHVLIFVIVFVASASCNRTNNYIIPVDYEKYYKDITSLTEKEGQELHNKIMIDWYNTQEMAQKGNYTHFHQPSLRFWQRGG